MMTSPLKVVPTFAAVTGRLSAEDRNKLALKAVLIASTALLLTIFVGRGIMSSREASPQAVGAAAGLLLSSSALQAIHGKHAPAGSDGATEPNLAMSPLAFPSLVPPYAVGVLAVHHDSGGPPSAQLGH